ncbi:hypothetical protein F2Q69_00006840 [Brassica cretica]|uniref:Uncharacterized protein n=1 Tax=Brassica cretica TaxID=69181 RepID=A0A8S9NZ50_BRACR|nr:hypothetical protein F2Q69_00006840 [Brassica cretica]
MSGHEVSLRMQPKHADRHALQACILTCGRRCVILHETQVMQSAISAPCVSAHATGSKWAETQSLLWPLLTGQ